MAKFDATMLSPSDSPATRPTWKPAVGSSSTSTLVASVCNRSSRTCARALHQQVLGTAHQESISHKQLGVRVVVIPPVTHVVHMNRGALGKQPRPLNGLLLPQRDGRHLHDFCTKLLE